MKFNTKTIHGGQKIDPAFNSVMQPIYQTSTYAQQRPGVNKGFEYSRTHNPTRTLYKIHLQVLKMQNTELHFHLVCSN